MSIHATALVDAGAQLGTDTEIGPYALIGPGVRVGDRCRIGPHASLLGPLVLGEDCVVGYSAALGHDPQIKGEAGPFGGTRIGQRNVFREFAQVHRSMSPEGETRVGCGGFFMVGAHIGHDCAVGDDVFLCNNAALGGHVEVQDRAFISANCAVHQFSRVGELAMVAGLTAVHRDVPPFCMIAGLRPTTIEGLNVVGLRRAEIPAPVRRALQHAIRILFRSDLPLSERLAAVEPATPEVERLIQFLRDSRRGVIGFGGGRRG